MPLEKHHRNQWPHTSTRHSDTKLSCYSEPVHSYIFSLPATIQTLQLFALSPRIYSVRSNFKQATGSWGRWESTLLSVHHVCTHGPPMHLLSHRPTHPRSHPSSQTQPSSCLVHTACGTGRTGWRQQSVGSQTLLLFNATAQHPALFNIEMSTEIPFKTKAFCFVRKKESEAHWCNGKNMGWLTESQISGLLKRTNFKNSLHVSYWMHSVGLLAGVNGQHTGKAPGGEPLPGPAGRQLGSSVSWLASTD